MFYKTSEPHGLPHNPFKSCVVPRPIAWVTSMSASGVLNLAPYSFFNALTDDPPMIMLAFNGYHDHGGEKDTLANIKATGEFVINMVPLSQKEAMNVTTEGVAPEVDEIELARLQTKPSRLVRPPRVAAAPIHFECEFYSEIELPCNQADSINRMIIGRVIGIHIDDTVLVDTGNVGSCEDPYYPSDILRFCSIDVQYLCMVLFRSENF